MGAIKSHKSETIESPWDGPANVARARSGESQAYYGRIYAWQDPEGDETTKAAYKFPHHQVSEDGEPGAANVAGCQAGIAVLNGGRGGADIPEGDRQGVHSHLAAHLRAADKEPPELKSGEGAETERRVYTGPLEIREGADGEPVIAGYAALFNVWSQDLGGFVEQITPGFFLSVLDHDIRGLWQHDPAFVLGRTTNGTLRLFEDGTGLQVSIKPPESQWARDALVSLRRGDVNQMSFGFEVEADHWERPSEETGGISRRTLIRAKRLYDVSPVTFPAYPQTSVSVRQYLADLQERTVQDAGADNATEGADLRAREALRLRIRVRTKGG